MSIADIDILDWRADALCTQVDPETFFPEGKGASTHEAKKICCRCEVRAQCLADALEREDRFGVHGGMSERERRKLSKAGWKLGDPLPEVRFPNSARIEQCPQCGKWTGHLRQHVAMAHRLGSVA